MAMNGDLSSGAINMTPYQIGDTSSQNQTIADLIGDATGHSQPAKLGKYYGNDSDYLLSMEDWIRGEQSANNAHIRDLEKMREQNAFNSSEAQLQRDYETEMSNTSYQRAVEDMKKAGLNPILAYQQGGASTPSGATASSGSGGSSQGHYSRSNSVSSSQVALLSGLVHAVGSAVGAFAPNVSYVHTFKNK